MHKHSNFKALYIHQCLVIIFLYIFEIVIVAERVTKFFLNALSSVWHTYNNTQVLCLFSNAEKINDFIVLCCVGEIKGKVCHISWCRAIFAQLAENIAHLDKYSTLTKNKCSVKIWPILL